MPLGLFSRPFSEHDSNDSTRAPLWGATTTNRFPRRPSAVSTHAPLWGATATSCPGALGGSQFQPTRPYGARRVGYVRAVVVVGFNPRAPMGRDERMHLTPPPCCEFQPTRPYGARPRGSAVARCPASRFQPTRPYGARRRGCGPIGIRAGFNPRAPMGRDVACYIVSQGTYLVSTHAPLWGATGSLCRIVHFSLVVFIFQDA